MYWIFSCIWWGHDRQFKQHTRKQQTPNILSFLFIVNSNGLWVITTVSSDQFCFEMSRKWLFVLIIRFSMNSYILRWISTIHTIIYIKLCGYTCIYFILFHELAYILFLNLCPYIKRVKYCWTLTCYVQVA